ncbi:MAG: EamA family transporter [Balneolales bacterium]
MIKQTLPSTSTQWIGALAFFIIYFVWGANFLATRFAIESIPPFFMVGTRFFVAGVILHIWLRLNGEGQPSFLIALPSIRQGIWLNVLGTGGVVWSQQHIPSGLAAIMLSMIPVWMVVLDRAKWKQNFSNFYTGAGLVAGLVGVLLLSDYNALGYLSENEQTFYTALLVLVAGTICWSRGSLFTRKAGSEISLPMSLSIQMTAAGALLYVAGLLRGEQTMLVIADVTQASVIALLFLIVFSSIIGYLAYLWLLKTYPPALVGTYAYAHPLIAVYLGWLLADEQITIQTILSMGMILLAIFLIKYAHREKPNEIKKVSSPS